MSELDEARRKLAAAVEALEMSGRANAFQALAAVRTAQGEVKRLEAAEKPTRCHFHHLLIGGAQCGGCDFVAPLSENQLLIAAMGELTTELRAFREAWDRPTGPARGLITNIRNSPDHKHRTGHRMGFGPAYVQTEEPL